MQNLLAHTQFPLQKNLHVSSPQGCSSEDKSKDKDDGDSVESTSKSRGGGSQGLELRGWEL